MPGSTVDHKEVIEVAAQTNALLSALMNHPQLNRSDPLSSPKPLFFTTDFVRRTYLEYLLPLLPPEAYKRSSKIANRYIFQYDSRTPYPEEANDAWLEDVNNWPRDRNSAKSKERYYDAVGRNTMIALAINDPVQGAMIMQGQFDWENPVNIKTVAAPMLADTSS